MSNETQRRRILVTGAGGMVGSAVRGRLLARGATVLAPTRRDLDLTNGLEVERYFAAERPDLALLIAARVGGIAANIADPVGFLRDNLLMELHFMEACRRSGVKKVLFLGSSCMYPRECPQPMREEFLYGGPVEPTNHGYAVAKLVGWDLATAYRKQYGMDAITLIPCNLYGTGDDFDLQRSHVLSALVRRFHEATAAGLSEIVLWGTGNARREFMHVDDAADAIVYFLETYSDPAPINIGTGTDVTIRDLAHEVARLSSYTGRIHWDPSRPDGMPRKCLDVTRMRALGFEPRITLGEGIARTVAEYRTLAKEGRLA